MAFKSPKETVAVVENIGVGKAALSKGQLLVLGFLAGAFIAFGGLLAIVVGGGVPGIKAVNPGLQKFIFGAVFPVGLVLVVIAGAELFTGNTACCIPAALSKKIRWNSCARNWCLSYIGNFAGSLFVAFFLSYLTGLLLKSPWLETTMGIAEGKVSQGFWMLFFKGVGCNWLVCLAVWLAVSADDITGKILGVWFPIMAFVALGFEHSIANMFFVPLGIFYGADVTWGRFFIVNLIPVTLGNIVGGAFFVGTTYWFIYAYIIKRKSAEEERRIEEKEGISVLMIEDDRDFVNAVSAFLSKEPYTIRVAYNRDEAMEKIRKKKPDLILLDLMLERADDGFTICETLKSDPEYDDIPIIAISGIASEIGLAPELGDRFKADAFIEKPVKSGDLCKKMESLIGHGAEA